mmetsp:Transcript_21335/g.46239  ORF Transcript_21335/g.46239 Transcript_21335/m.46239 type:complete len:216 (+) Transcript_21335:161-808(+)
MRPKSPFVKVLIEKNPKASPTKSTQMSSMLAAQPAASSCALIFAASGPPFLLVRMSSLVWRIAAAICSSERPSSCWYLASFFIATSSWNSGIGNSTSPVAVTLGLADLFTAFARCFLAAFFLVLSFRSAFWSSFASNVSATSSTSSSSHSSPFSSFSSFSTPFSSFSTSFSSFSIPSPSSFSSSSSILNRAGPEPTFTRTRDKNRPVTADTMRAT